MLRWAHWNEKVHYGALPRFIHRDTLLHISKGDNDSGCYYDWYYVLLICVQKWVKLLLSQVIKSNGHPWNKRGSKIAIWNIKIDNQHRRLNIKPGGRKENR